MTTTTVARPTVYFLKGNTGVGKTFLCETLRKACHRVYVIEYIREISGDLLDRLLNDAAEWASLVLVDVDARDRWEWNKMVSTLMHRAQAHGFSQFLVLTMDDVSEFHVDGL